MKTATLFVFCLATAAFADDRGALPQDCRDQCEAEFELMEDFSVLTKTSDIERVFGSGRNLQTSAGYHVDWHQREQAAFVVVRRAGTKSREAVAIFRNTQQPHHIRIPYLGLIDGDTRIATLADTSLSYLKQNCFGPVVGAERGRFWTPACYFGRPGTYRAYHFLFEEQTCRSADSTDGDLNGLWCADDSTIMPVGALVTEWRPHMNQPGAAASLLLDLDLISRTAISE